MDAITLIKKRCAMRAKMLAVVERALTEVAEDTAGVLATDGSNYEHLVRQEFASLAQDFAGEE